MHPSSVWATFYSDKPVTGVPNFPVFLFFELAFCDFKGSGWAANTDYESISELVADFLVAVEHWILLDSVCKLPKVAGV